MISQSVRDAMTEELRSIGTSASAVDAAQLMRDEHVGSLPVVDEREARRHDHRPRHREESLRRQRIQATTSVGGRLLAGRRQRRA